MPLQDYAVFFHGTARDAKKWAPANWIATGQALAPMPVLLAWGSPGEKQEAETLAAALPNAKVLPKLSMDEAVTLARNAALAIGVDTGLTHIAAAFVRPTIETVLRFAEVENRGQLVAAHRQPGRQGRAAVGGEVTAAAERLVGRR
jgi:heptosyltransferase-1